MRSFSRAAAKEEQKKQYTDHANIRRKCHGTTKECDEIIVQI
jgi:hypothetical protein